MSFVSHPTARTWYRAHNASIASAYLEHRDLADGESRAERFFLNVVLLRVLYAHALVAAPRLALGRLASLAPFLGDPRLGMTGIFLSLSRVLPDRYPLWDNVAAYVAAERNIGQMLDYGLIGPRLQRLYEWSAQNSPSPRCSSAYATAARPMRGHSLIAMYGIRSQVRSADADHPAGLAVAPGRYDRAVTDAVLRIGLVGYGFGGRYFHAPLIASCPRLRAGRGGDPVPGPARRGRPAITRASRCTTRSTTWRRLGWMPSRCRLPPLRTPR